MFTSNNFACQGHLFLLVRVVFWERGRSQREGAKKAGGEMLKECDISDGTGFI